MRVLLTTDTIGGVWTFTKELTAGLLSHGHAVALVSFGRMPSPAQYAWCSAMSSRYGNDFRYEPCTTPLEWMEDNAGAYEAALPLLLDVTSAFGPDVIHSNQFCFGALPVTEPVLITAHSDVLSWADACRPAGLESSEWLARYRRLVEQGLQDASAVVAPTRWMLDACQANFPFAAPGRVIFNGRNIQPQPTQTKRLQAVSAGRLWDEGKNVALLAEINSPMPLLIAGDQQHETASIAADTGNLTMLGQLDEAALLSLFAESAIYIAPSKYEPFGLAPIEAAQCGCAVLANDIPSLREVWADSALYFNDAATLKSLLDRLYHSPDELRRAQIKSERHARQFTATRMTEEYLALYNEVLQLKSLHSSSARELVLNAC